VCVAFLNVLIKILKMSDFSFFDIGKEKSL